MKSCPVPLLLNNPRNPRMRHPQPQFRDRIIETFDGGADTPSSSPNKIQCTKDVETGSQKNPSDNIVYSQQRNNNIQELRKQYNSALKDYINAHNDDLVSKALNAPDPSINNDASKAESKLQQIQHALTENNEQTENLIKSNEAALAQKGKLIEDKNSRISKQQTLIQERNDILNSRKRQIEMGLEKNIYKRNLMYFLIFVNIIVILVLVGLIHRSS